MFALDFGYNFAELQELLTQVEISPFEEVKALSLFTWENCRNKLNFRL